MSTDASRFELQLLLAAGFAACLAYPLGVFAPLPIPVRTLLLAFFGPPVLLLSLNLATFPTPPANAGLFDVGPGVGAWYLVVTVAASRGLRRLAAADAAR